MTSPEKQANKQGGLPAGAQFIVQSAGDQQGNQQVIQLGQGGQRIQLAGGAQSIQLAGGAQNIQLPGGQRIQLTTATGQRIVLPQQGISQQILQQLQKQSGGQRIVVQQPGQQQQQIVLQPGTSVQQVVSTQQPQPATTVQQQQQKLVLQQQKAQQKLLQQQILQKQQQQQQQQQQQLLQKQQQPAQPGTQTIRVVAPQGQQVVRPAQGMQVLQIQQPGGQGVQKIIISKEQLQQLQLKGNLGQQLINLQQGEVKAATSGQQILVRPQQVQKVQQIQVAQQLPTGKLNKPKTVAEHVAQAQAQKTVTVQQMLKSQQSPLKQGAKPILVEASSGQQILTTGTMQSPVRAQQQARVAVASPVRAVAPQSTVRSVTPAQLMQAKAKQQQQKVVVSAAPNQLPRSVAPAPAQNIVVSSAPVQVTTQPGKTLNIMAARPKVPATSVNTNAQTLKTMQLVNTVPPTQDPSAAKKGLKTILPTPTAPKAQQTTKSLLPGQQQAIQPKTSKLTVGVTSAATVLTTTTAAGGGTPRVISLVPSQPGVTSSATRAALATAGTSAVKQALGGVTAQAEAMAVGVEEVEVTDSGAPPARVVHTSPIKTREHQKAKQKAAKHRRQQDKANQIILEAIKKAKEEGRELPPHIEPLPTDPTLELTTEDGEPRRKKEKKAKKDKRDRPHRDKVDKPKPLKKKSTKAKRPIPDSLLAKRERRKRRQEEMDDASDGEMAHIVEKAHTRKFYVPPDIDDECKRRSSRNTKRRKYNDEVELPSDHTSSSSDENVDVDDTGVPEKNSKKKKSSSSKKKKKEQVLLHSESSHQSSVVQDSGAVEEENVVEKILGMRLGTRTRPRADVDLDILNYDDIEIPQETVQVEEYYVKYRNYSYLHCEWKTEEELLKGDKRIPQKIRRFKTHKLPFMDPYLHDEEDLFNQDYLEIDRVLDKAVTYEPPDNEMVIHYLVKWRSLPYEDATWELEQDVDNELIERWNINQIMPPENERDAIARPRAYKWTKIPKSPVYRNENTLREYQLEGLNWLSFCYHNKQNCILADEMGLGKTIQSITFLKTVFDYGIKGPFLVIVPLSTLANWQREFDLWTNMNAVTYHGTSASRRMIQDYELYFRDDKLNIIPDIYKFHAVITTYEIIISDVELLSSIEWRVVIIDEAHRLKNKNCKLAEGLGYFDMEHRVLLTGTPLQNNTEELFSLLNFLEPSRFNNLDEFLKDFGELRTESQVKQLKSLLKPMMLRRLKEDVEKSLAPKEETIVEVEMTNTQKKFYRAILERNFAYLAKGGTSANVPNLMNTMMELRKCCNHPYLIDGAESRVIQEHRERYGDRADTQLKSLVQSCGKMVLLDKLLPRLYADKHRVLIFSQMIRVLDILEDYVVQKGYLYERLDGRIRGNHRQEAIDRFSKKDSDRFIFLLCTRAGGLGINLTAADTVVIYDSDWNPQNDLQAQARCHRIGQKKAVKMYRLITRNSYEREMFDKASMKLGLDKAVLQSNSKQGDGEEGKAQLSKREIEDLLKKGAYGAIMDDEKAGDAFCEEDIDLILARRTQVIQVESEGKGSTFAKASFSASGNRDDIDIDDPEFWDKWARKADIDTDGATTQLIVEEPRRRKQTARYGGQDTLTNMSELETSDSDSDKDKKSKKKEKERDEKDLDVEDPDDKEKRKKEKKKQVKRRKKKEKEQQEEEQKPQPLPREAGYVRSEMFKVEKNMMVFGYGRWDDIHLHARFRRRIFLDDVVEIAKALLLYSLRYYAGDERIKRFIYDLVNPKEDVDIKNHTGLSAPVPRGRKGKKTVEDSAQQSTDELEAEIAAQCGIDPEKILGDEGYKKHLQRHANKVLLRVRLLYYLKQEVIGNDNADMITAGVNHEIIDLPPVSIDNNVKPCDWWDDDADKSLLIGVFKHGYEKFHAIRQDPCLCFLERCGPPDGTALAREQNDEDDFLEPDIGKAADQKPPGNDLDEDREDGELRDDEDSQGEADKDRTPAEPAQDGKFPFPSFSDLNTRFRRVITSYQKIHKRALHKMAKHEKKRERIEAVTKEREQKKRDSQQRWSRREEMDFYRIVSSYGVEYDTESQGYRWEKFRTLARLEKKYDDTMTDYFLAFYFMCCCVCKRLATDAPPPNDLSIEPITEERANRCLARIDLLNKIREETLRHPELDDRLRLCEYGHDLPDWWEPGKHDKELLKGAARHGLARTDFHILHDPDLLFKEIVQNKSMYVPPKLDPDGETSNSRRGGDSSDDENYSHDRPVVNGQVIKVEPGLELHEVADRGSSAEDGAPQAPQHGERKPFSVKEMVAKIKAEAAAKIAKFTNPPYGGHPSTPGTPGRDEDLENDAHEPTVAELLAKNVAPAVQWPKDRTVFHRLEQVCTCVDKNEWPTMRRNQGYGLSRDLDGSYGSTPTGTPRPSGRGDTPLGDGEEWGVQVGGKNDGLKLTIGKRKYRSKKLTFEEAMRGDQYGDSDTDLAQMYKQMKGSPGEKKKRGRKSKVEKMILEAQARHEAVERMMLKAQRRLQGFDDPDFRVPVVNHENGDRLSGDEAPLRRYVASWLNKNPGYTIDLPYDPEDELDSKWTKKPRRHKIDPAKLDWDNLTGEENVSVVNTVTGKRVTGAKAPELRYLARFLEHNPNYNVDSKWAHLVRTKANLPERYLSRILSPASEKPGSPRVPSHTHPLMQSGATKMLGATPLLGVTGLNPAMVSNLYGMQLDDSKNEEAIKALVKAAQQQKAQQQQQGQLPVVVNQMVVNQLGQKSTISLPSGSNIPTQITTSMTMAEAQAALKNGIIFDGGKILKTSPPTEMLRPSQSIGMGSIKKVGGKTTISVSPRSILKPKPSQPQVIHVQPTQVTKREDALIQPAEIVIGGMETVCTVQDVPDVSYLEEIPMQVMEEVVTEEVATTQAQEYYQQQEVVPGYSQASEESSRDAFGQAENLSDDSESSDDSDEEEEDESQNAPMQQAQNDSDDDDDLLSSDDDDDEMGENLEDDDDDEVQSSDFEDDDESTMQSRSDMMMMSSQSQNVGDDDDDDDDDSSDSDGSGSESDS